ncbi:MAG: type II CRISPR RNA-guided endonuclease Cas9 [Pseudomonadota bacterium]
MRIKTLGLDLGTNSLGWCLIETDGEPGEKEAGRVIDLGVRIFSQAEMAGRDAKSKESLAKGRREARSARRRRDRYLKRREKLLAQLIEAGLMPDDKHAQKQLLEETSDGEGGNMDSSVYALRARALDKALEPYELGRALFHLNQRRGFKSNRKTDSNDAEQGKIASAITRLEEQMAEEDCRTFGEWLHKRRQTGLSVRARMASDGKAYDFYPSRAALEHEFDRIAQKQKLFHPGLLTDAVLSDLRETIFFQRRLRPVQPGKCSYNPAEERLPKAHPLFQSFRLVKEVNELGITGEDKITRKLTPDQRDTLLLLLRTKLNKQGKAPFSKLRKALKLPQEVRFNKESETRRDIEGDVVCFRMSQAECFGNSWSTFDVDRQAEIVERLRSEQDREVLVDWLRSEFGYETERARTIADTPVPDGYGRLGKTALASLTDEMLRAVDEDGCVVPEAEASKTVYGRTNSESDPDRKALPALPKYQEVLERHIPPGTGGKADPKTPEWDEVMGRITNPTVHIALNQLRRVVNAVIRKHGTPDRIAVEVGRDLKLNEEKRKQADQRNASNKRIAEGLSKELTEIYGQRDTGYNRLRLRLWKELDPEVTNRVCVYTGKVISAQMVFSDETDIDHILPYSATLDDGYANKVLCIAAANREKKNRAPADVPQWRDRLPDILARASVLPKNKQWRFAEGAMERFGEGGFLARQLTDMQYISRLALTYLSFLYNAEEVDVDGVVTRNSHVRALPGRTTEMLRRNWALNDILHDHNVSDVTKPKNRLDHRHHAIDAAVVACTSRSLIQKLATASARAEEDGAERAARATATPWPEFRNDLREAISSVVVSHKADHGTVSRSPGKSGRDQTAGKLHNDTAYGYTGEKDAKSNDLVVVRKAITSLSSKDIDAIRTNDRDHSELRDRLKTVTRGLSGKDLAEALQRFVETDDKFGYKEWTDPDTGKRKVRQGIRHVRIVEPLRTIPIRGRDGKPFKGYKGDSNHRYDVWRLPDGTWKSDVVSTFNAHNPEWASDIKSEYPSARKLLSLQQGDCLAIEQEGSRRICRIVKFTASGNLTASEHHEAGPLKARNDDKNDPFRYINVSPGSMRKMNVRQVRIDEIGQVFDPGPWWRSD